MYVYLGQGRGELLELERVEGGVAVLGAVCVSWAMVLVCLFGLLGTMRWAGV